MRQGFRATNNQDNSDVRGHKGFNAVQKMKFRAAAIQFAEKLQAYRATNRGAVFDEVGSGEGEEYVLFVWVSSKRSVVDEWCYNL